MGASEFRVVLVVPTVREWPFQWTRPSSTAGRIAKQALRIAERASRGAGLDVVFYGYGGKRKAEVAVRTRLQTERREEWLRDWTYLPEQGVRLTKKPPKGACLGQHFGAGLGERAVRPLPAVREVFQMVVERPGHTLVLFWLSPDSEAGLNDAVFFLRRHAAPRVFWQFFTVVQDEAADRYWKRDGRHRGEDLPNLRFRTTWRPAPIVRGFRRWRKQLGPKGD